ncbi:antirestriction protein ArdR [Gammaproteobacteria bacterium]|nr:antirestriction protein ArdR [Gammaproteobacteria bacterium]
MLAKQWRDAHPDHVTTGVVLFWQGKPYGWKASLCDANHERPGAIAVDSAGNRFVAEGGDDANGAKLWVVPT